MSKTIHFPQEVATALRARLIADAVKHAEEYPQYQTYFDDHLLVRANKDLIGRYNKICDAGQFLLAAPEVLQYRDFDTGEIHRSICIWDMAEMSAKHVTFEDIDFIEKMLKLTLRIDY